MKSATVTPCSSRLRRAKFSPGFHLSLLLHSNVQPGPPALQKTLDHIVASKAKTQLVAGHPRLAHSHYGGANAQSVTDVDGLLQYAFRCEVFAKNSPGKLAVRKFPAPGGIVLGGVEVDGFKRPAVD